MTQQQPQDALIDLGTASEETKGVGMFQFDEEGGQRIGAGLADD